MNRSSFSLSGQTRRTTAFALLVSGLAIATAFGSRDLDAFTDALQTVATRYAGVALPTTPAIGVVSVTTDAPVASAVMAWPVAASATVGRLAMPAVASSVSPLPLTSKAVDRPAVRSIERRQLPVVAIGGASVAAEYHLPAPTVAGRREEPTAGSFRTTAVVADADGRAVELADAAVLPARVLSSATPAVTSAAIPSAVAPRVLSTPAVVATPIGDPSPAAGPSSTPVAVVSRGRGTDPSSVSVVGAGLPDAGLPDADGWVPSAGVQPGGAPGELAWETVVDTGNGFGSGGVRGATSPGWTPGTGEIQDVIVNPDGSITVLPEPTALLGVALAAIVLRRRR